MRFRNCIVVILILCICFGMVGCNKSQDKATEGVTQHVKENTSLWYDTRKVDLNVLDDEIIADKTVLSDGRILVLLMKSIESKMPMKLICFLPNGEQEFEQDIIFDEATQILTCKLLQTPDGCMLNIKESKDKGQNYNMNLYRLDISDEGINYELIRNYDYNSGVAFDVDDDRLNSNKASNIANEYVGDYLLSLFQSGSIEYYAVITDKENTLTTVAISDLVDLNINDYFMIGAIIPKVGNMAEMIFRSNEGDLKYYDFDLKNVSLSEHKIEDEFGKETHEILDNCYNNMGVTYIHNGFLYVNVEGSIKRIDFINEKIDVVFDLNNCNINPAMMETAEVVEIKDSGDEFVFFTNLTYKSAKKLYYCTKSDKDFLANKIVLKLASLSKLSYDIGEKIYNFNNSEENEEYIIKYDKRYIVSEDDKNKTDTASDSEQLLTIQAILDSLVEDMKNGNGPDILMDVHLCEQLNNEDILVDLSSYFEELTQEDYFCNIIDATKKEDKLYYIPISFSAPNVALDTKVADNINEMNLKAFLSLIRTLKEGQIGIYNRLEWFIALIGNMENEIVKDGEINVNTEEFKVITELIKEIPDKGYDYSNKENAQAVYRVDLSDVLMDENIYREDSRIKLYPFPTYSGTIDMAYINSSIAVSAFSENKDVAWKFIKEYIESEDKEVLTQTYFVNRNALKKSVMSEVDMFNRAFDVVEEEIKAENLKIHRIDGNEAVARIVNFANSVTHVSHTYNFELLVVIYEDLEPYFENRLSYDQVLENIQKHCEEILNKQVESR